MVVLSGFNTARADEGMWFLKLMEQQHLADSLRKAGLQLPAEALINNHAPALSDCIGIFGGGCTGEVVSPEGLILTNHHCGFSYVHTMSGIGHDYMKDGYFARSRAEELPTPEDLTFTFVLRVTDVTKEVEKEAAKKKVDEYVAQSRGFLQPIAEKLLKKSDLKNKKGLRVMIQPFFAGNSFYMFYLQTYKDIRLVANPPYNIGQFGGNGDNWIWPRHSADFAMFRIYADKNGDPAPYSPENVPLKVDKYLPISLAGPKENDYTMVMGFPGSTSRFLTAEQVKMRCSATNEPIVIAGNPLLDYYKELMGQSDELRLLVEDEYFGWGNTIKNFGGMNEAVEKIGLVEEKQEEEARFRAFAAESGKPAYKDVIDRIAKVCATYRDSIHDLMLFRITLGEQNLSVPSKPVKDFVAAVKAGKAEDIEALKADFLEIYDNNKLINRTVEIGKLKVIAPYFANHKKLAAAPDYIKNNSDLGAYYEHLYKESVFADSARLMKAFAERDTTTLLNDPLYVQAVDTEAYYYAIARSANNYKQQLLPLEKIYQRGLCEMYDWTKAPDANFTMRMTYGHICDLEPRDAVRYDWRTVLDGVFEKESKTDHEYFVNEKLRTFFLNGNYGRYADENGKLPTCFLSNNDITGGNSGSGVLNAKGELIGLAFDGNIESLSSDLKYNARLQRCINVDIRYVLFMIEEFGGAKYVIDELDIR